VSNPPRSVCCITLSSTSIKIYLLSSWLAGHMWGKCGSGSMNEWLRQVDNRTTSKTTSKSYRHIYFLNTQKLEDSSCLVCYLASTVKQLPLAAFTAVYMNICTHDLFFHCHPPTPLANSELYLSYTCSTHPTSHHFVSVPYKWSLVSTYQFQWTLPSTWWYNSLQTASQTTPSHFLSLHSPYTLWFITLFLHLMPD
jgi:hypothetical protein